jgi:hypothetical protein
MENILRYGLMGILLAIALVKPELAGVQWRRLEKLFGRLARRRAICCLAMGALVLVTRLALLPIWEEPKPYIYDEFGYLLQADTFAAGRLTNPTPALWQFFESPYILMKPTYTSKYAPGQGMAMALGQVVFGHPWCGVWLSCGVLMAVLCWALQGWLSPGWALFGAVLALKLCLFSYWMDSYWGGAVAAIGGALMLGAFPRIVNEGRWGYSWLLGLGAVMLALTRMYEGLLFVIPILAALLLKRQSIRVWALSGVVVALGGAFVLYYNYRVTGHASELPYIEHQRQYGYAPYFSFQSLEPEATYRHKNLFDLSHGWEFEKWQESRSLGVFKARGLDWYKTLADICGGVVLVVPFCLFLWPAWRNRRWSLPFYCAAIVFVGSFCETIYYTHYAAPAAAAILLVLVCTLQELRKWDFNGKSTGRFLSRGVPVAAFLVLMGHEGTRLYKQEPIQATKPVNARKGLVEQMLLEQKGGKHVILVRYTKAKTPHEEWIYNRADIDGSDVIWAQDMGTEENRKIVDYYKGRSIWLMQPDENPEAVEPY